MARLGSIPNEANMLDFLYLHRHCMSAPERAMQQVAEGGGGFAPDTDGLHAIRPSVVMPHIVWPMATVGSWPVAMARTNATMTSFCAYASISLI